MSHGTDGGGEGGVGRRVLGRHIQKVAWLVLLSKILNDSNFIWKNKTSRTSQKIREKQSAVCVRVFPLLNKILSSRFRSNLVAGRTE